MRRFFFVMILASSALRATSVVEATCILGTITQNVTDPTSTSCSIPFVVDGMEVGFVGGDASISGLTVEADGGYASNSSSFPDVPYGGGGTASYSQTFATAGPKRPGFIEAYSTLGFGGIAQASLTQNGTSLTSGGLNIGPPELIPFELGEPFQVSLLAEDGGGGDGGPCSDCAGDTFASITLVAITEADGTTGVPYFAVVTPEPATSALLLLGLVACIPLQARARTARLRRANCWEGFTCQRSSMGRYAPK